MRLNELILDVEKVRMHVIFDIDNTIVNNQLAYIHFLNATSYLQLAINELKLTELYMESKNDG